MSNIKNVFDISGRAMAAQLVRLNTVASNLANAGNIAGSKEEAYKSIKPVFETKFAEHAKTSGLATVDAVEVKQVSAEPEKSFMPEHPQADSDGYVYKAAVNVDQEMVEMMEAGRQYQNNIEVVTTLKALTLKTINLGK